MAIDWLDIFTKLSAGIYTLEEAAKVAGVSVAHLEAQVLTASRSGTGRMAELAGRIITRYGITELGAAAAGSAAGTTAAATGGVSLATVVGGIVVFALLAGGVYVLSGQLGRMSADDPVQAGPAMLNRAESGDDAQTPVCPEQVQTARKCPWSPEGYTVEPCGPGFCYDSGPRGTGACEQENQNVPNAHVGYTLEIICNDGFPNAVRDPCTNVILRCEA